MQFLRVEVMQAHQQRPDLYPEGTDNENVIVLPKCLFVDLINAELQRRIV